MGLCSGSEGFTSKSCIIKSWTISYHNEPIGSEPQLWNRGLSTVQSVLNGLLTRLALRAWNAILQEPLWQTSWRKSSAFINQHPSPGSANKCYLEVSWYDGLSWSSCSWLTRGEPTRPLCTTRSGLANLVALLRPERLGSDQSPLLCVCVDCMSVSAHFTKINIPGIVRYFLHTFSKNDAVWRHMQYEMLYFVYVMMTLMRLYIYIYYIYTTPQNKQKKCFPYFRIYLHPQV